MNASRRRFLVRSGWIAGGLTVVGSAGGCSLIPPLPTFAGSDEADILTWVQLTDDGRVRYLLSRAELGQGISTGLSQVVAEELALPLTAIDCQHQSTAVMAPCQMTVGSQSIENYLTLTARAAAFLRETLRQRAAHRLDVRASALTLVEGGRFVVADGRSVGYDELLIDGEVSLAGMPVTGELTLRSARSPRDLAVVGRPVEPVHVRRIVTGAEVYSRDVRLENMGYGVVARPPQLGAKRIGFDAQAAAQVPGVLAVVQHEDELGVVAATPMAAARGLDALAVRWAPLAPDDLAAVQQSLDIDLWLENDALDHRGERLGSLEQGAAAASRTFSFRYDSPMAAHAAMEPRSGVARWYGASGGETSCEIWTGSQDAWMVQAAAARALGVSRERVVVHNHRVGGGFGGRVLCQASVEAAWLSQAAGVPVKVQWSREEEFRYNYVGPQFSTRIDAGLDASGRITHWHHRAVGAPVLTSSTFVPPHLHWVANRVPDPGTKRGMALPYAIAHRRLAFADERVPMSTGPWRGLGAAPNTFAVECAMDELALAADETPINFRLRHLEEPRLKGCLQRLQQKLAGDAPTFGIAAASYKGVTFLALAAQVEVSAGGLRVTRLVCVHDCGRVISPDQVRAQIEGNLVWGVGMALFENFELSGGIAATSNFDRYVLPRNGDVPDMEIELVDSAAAPSGAAEAALAPAAAAIANAAFVATGVRYRQLPLQVV